MTLTLDFQGQGLINMEQKGYESIGCYTYYIVLHVTLSYDFDLEFWRSNLKKTLS